MTTIDKTPHEPYDVDLCDVFEIVFGLLHDGADELDTVASIDGELTSDGHAHVVRLRAADGDDTFTVTVERAESK